MEVAFECRSTTIKGEVHLEPDWFEERLEQCMFFFFFFAEPKCAQRALLTMA
jgi:hypothetical protein